jgi:hypothetical protein
MSNRGPTRHGDPGRPTPTPRPGTRPRCALLADTLRAIGCCGIDRPLAYRRQPSRSDWACRFGGCLALSVVCWGRFLAASSPDRSLHQAVRRSPESPAAQADIDDNRLSRRAAKRLGRRGRAKVSSRSCPSEQPTAARILSTMSGASSTSRRILLTQVFEMFSATPISLTV